jgi:hypothetical protein
MARYRALSATGDYTFGQGSKNFLINSPAMVGQKVRTRLLLWLGEFFLDKTEGTPWETKVVGKNKNPTYDLVIQQRILQTEGVRSIVSYNSVLTHKTRGLAVSVTILTIYSNTPVEISV